jgi:Family of unknown function (DUF6262)
MLDNRAALAAATQRRSTGARERARAALRQLDRQGTPITFVVVAEAAKVSRALLYRDAQLRAEVERLRETAHPTRSRLPSAIRATEASLQSRLETLLDDLQTLRTENHQLKETRSPPPRRATCQPTHRTIPTTTCPAVGDMSLTTSRTPHATPRKHLQITANLIIEKVRRPNTRPVAPNSPARRPSSMSLTQWGSAGSPQRSSALRCPYWSNVTLRSAACCLASFSRRSLAGRLFTPPSHMLRRRANRRPHRRPRSASRRAFQQRP